MESLAGFVSSWLIFTAILGLHLVLPARRVTGYVTKNGTDELISVREKTYFADYFGSF